MSEARRVRVVVVGECLLELVRAGADGLETRPAGDTFNTASMLVRAGRALSLPVRVEYRTGLGDDPLSGTIADAIAEHGLVDAAVRVPGRACGLYLLDGSSGDMWYWRGDSAAHHVFQGVGWVPRGDADLVFLSLITLQQMSPEARDRAHEWLAEIRAGGGLVAFSANHRAAGWPSVQAAAAETSRFAAAADVVFASAADCRAVFGTADIGASIERFGRLGVGEIIITAGASGATVAADGARIDLPAVPPASAVDPTGAGDAFAGTYLAWRLADRSPSVAAKAAVRAASAAVTFVGALPRSGSGDAAGIDHLLAWLAMEP